MSSLAKLAVSSTYLENQEMVEKIAKQFYYKHGGNLAELISEANEYFMDIYHGYNNEVVIGNEKTKDKSYYSPFPVYLRQKMIYKFLDKARSIATKRNGHLQEFGYDVEWLKDKEYFSIDNWLDDLSSDAKFVAQLAIDPPPDIRLTAKQNGGDSFGCDMRAGIVAYLSDRATWGWSGQRIWDAMQEVKDAIQNNQ